MLTFKGSYICHNDKEIAFVDVLDYLRGTEKYAVHLKSLCDRLTASELRQYIAAANQMQPSTIAEAAIIQSLKEKLEEKLHQCMLATDFSYRLSYELSQCKEQSRVLEKSLDEERKRRWELEREVDKLKKSLQKLEESESESDETN